MNPFDLTDRVAVVTGGGGTLGGHMAQALARAGARVAVLGRTPEPLHARAAELDRVTQGLALTADVLDRPSLEAARDRVLERWGRIDVLINAAGGNQPGATVGPDARFEDLGFPAFEQVVALNLHGTVGPCAVFASALREAPAASVVNVSSMAASRPLTRVVGYAAAKAGVDNFTRWLAVEWAHKGYGIRVNALAPGFVLADQNRALLTQPAGALTPRVETIVSHTPQGRLGDPSDLDGAVVWLASDASAFVTGAVIPVDGGFGAFSGV